MYGFSRKVEMHMSKKIIVKEARGPLQIATVEAQTREDCVAQLFPGQRDMLFIPLNLTDTLYLVVDGSPENTLSENIYYIEEDKFAPPAPKIAKGMVMIIRVEWTRERGVKIANLVNVTDDDVFFAYAYVDESYQKSLREDLIRREKEAEQGTE